MKKNLMFLALAAIGLASCNGFKKGQHGLLYQIVSDKSGPSVQPGDFISINYIVKNDADSVLQSSFETGQQFSQIVPKPSGKGDVFAGISYLSEGDSAVIKTDLDSLSAGHPRPAGMKGKYMIFIVKVEKVIQKGNLDQTVFNGRCQAYVTSLMDVAKKAEPAKIKKYIADNNLKVTTTASGLDYVITKESSEPKPANGDTVAVAYVGKYLNGKVFDTSIKSEAVKAKLPINPMNPYKPLRFPLGTPGMIPGLNEAILLLSKGAKATIIMPSSLAYGERGNQMIGPFTPLVFEVELVDIVHPNPNAPKPVAPPMMAQPQQQPVKK
ncbi:FKBP-type peptidyl-prolyl cis-trans isomerase [Mucilaginibacter gotjawali]|uniref:FKBP-type peptidyl-prolyl cis-trans isomerase n=2 Tax=Mucilaginibacter gotjawali TaxID=1550579 RepID=A0A839SJP7_9SPHI|nr:FKBP-type peptidyl-prolyl cis-trans isomerase [Mucilaginibacter gotjawali]MBB3058076.1 FKBP-type peptidyl-prolyl cis-trans isomerase [Mucilaginibacter gotjawali]BAU52051.1 putative FKBP-type peptidyl-prolyl cis-trans isomerase FkpA precursor [Mucilaginibacter gotjawali]